MLNTQFKFEVMELTDWIFLCLGRKNSTSNHSQLIHQKGRWVRNRTEETSPNLSTPLDIQ